jgi:hypothetical protein
MNLVRTNHPYLRVGRHMGGIRSGGAPILLLVGARLAVGRHGGRWGEVRVRDREETGAGGSGQFFGAG